MGIVGIVLCKFPQYFPYKNDIYNLHIKCAKGVCMKIIKSIAFATILLVLAGMFTSCDLETTNAVFRGMRDGLNESDLGDDYYD